MIIKNNKFKRSRVGLATLALLASNAVAYAQSQTVLEEIVVTSQKRSQSIQDIAFSVSAFDTEDAERFGNDIGALAGQVPGVEAFGGNSYFQTFYVRGIGLNEFSGNFNPPIAQHKDEVYISKAWQASRPTFDIERIEVLKGPQGTLFGRNATGGAVNYYSVAPSEETSGYLKASVDDFSRASIEGAVGSALGDNVNARVSVYRGFGDGGTQDNLFTGEEHGEPDISEIRAQLQWNISDLTTANLQLYTGSDKSETLGYKSPGIFNDVTAGEAPGFCNEIVTGSAILNPASCSKFLGLTGDQNLEREPNDINTINQNNAPERDDEFSGGHLRFEHDFGNSTFTSLTSYDQYERRHREDADGTPVASNDTFYFNDLTVFSHEFRLNGSAADDRLNYVAGLFYLNEELDQADFLDFSENILVGAPIGLFGNFEQEVESIAAYFNADYALNDQWTLTLGGRYTQDETDIISQTGVSIPSTVGNNLPAQIIAVADERDDNRKDTNTSWRLGLSYEPTDSSLLYTNLATGFRTGGFSVPFGGASVEFEDETVNSIEFGYKADLSNTVRFNAATFFFVYEDFQVNVDDPISPIVPITRNIDEAETFGVEAELTWLPTSNTEIKLGYAYLDAELTETERTLTGFGPAPFALIGNAPVNSPENQINGSFQYFGQLSANWNWNTYLDFRWVDERFLELSNQPADTVDAYSVINGSIGIESADGVWDARLWVKNLTDETYVTYINNLPGAPFALNLFGEQRSLGVSLGYNF